jgi:citrate lyase subunit beta/citryl-CoA lyase
MPGANQRALEKARGLDCDAIIFDLEDAVAPGAKDTARRQVAAAVDAGGYGYRELIVRVNGVETPWYEDDLRAVRSLPVSAVLLPKVESVASIERTLELLAHGGGADKKLWLMMETPRGVMSADHLAGCCADVEALVMGTSDLVTELRARHTPGRENLLHALQAVVLAARANDCTVLDGVHLDFRDLDTFAAICAQGRDMGFDGKTLIHPSQIAPANAAFGPSAAAVEAARQVLEVWRQAQASGQGVVELNGRLVENLHVAEAERLLAYAAAIDARAGPGAAG